VTATMTYVGLDVHARSTHAAAIDVRSGELRRARFGSGSDEVIGWLRALPQPVKGCYEAGPTGFALYRAAAATGLRLDVVAPSKTPRAPGDRIKSDRKDAELLARLLLAGQLKPVTVPTPPFEAARHLARAREQVRGDLMRARHRVSKLLLLHGRVYERSAWTKLHRRWLEQQRFDEPATELAYLDCLAAVDGLIARKAALDERLSRLAREGAWWPTVARLRCFRGIDTLTAFVLVLEIGDFTRFPRPAKLAGWLGLVPSLDEGPWVSWGLRRQALSWGKEMLQRWPDRGSTPRSCVSALSASTSSRIVRSRTSLVTWASTRKRCASGCDRLRQIRAAVPIC
jgi:transposase